MKPFSSIGCCLIVALFLNGCKKNGAASGTGNTSVYIAGFDNGDIVYWKDGKENMLATAAPGYYGNASGIAVVNEDVYVAGYVGDTAVYWKNGTETALPYTTSAACYGMAISGADVYISGADNGNAVYGKNGILVSFVGSPAGTLATEEGNAITVVTN
jgi:hypothetical protein